MPSLISFSPAAAAEQVVFTGPLWRWTGGHSGAWFFVTIDSAIAQRIAGHALMRRLEMGQGRGFGSVKVAARVGDSAWSTSVFPNGDGTWILPVKAAIRRAEELGEGDAVTVELGLL